VLRIPCTYDPNRIAAQSAFRRSKARIRGYGGAMGGGKTRALCEEAFDWMLEYPGILLPVIRQVHTSMTNTTRKTFMEQTLPPELRGRSDLIRVKQSQGEDLVEFRWNGSQVHFIGLDNPGKVFSAEFGGAMFDESHEIAERDVLTINSRLRQRCDACVKAGIADCEHMPHRLVLTFNPSSPNHWLNQWFRLAAEPTEWGFRRDRITPTDAEEGASIGDMEFFLALVTANPFVPPEYAERNLGGMSARMRRRFLLGMWEHIDGSGYFDADALGLYHERAVEELVIRHAEPVGDLTGVDVAKPVSLIERSNGRMHVFKTPVRNHIDDQDNEVKAHRYVVACDASSGASADYSAVQVIDVDEMEQVAEWQGKVDTDVLAEIAFLTAVVYNGALLAVEITGGWGLNTMRRAQQLIARWKGNPKSQPRIYMRRGVSRLSEQHTDLIGFDTQTGTRALALGALEELVREDLIRIHGRRTLAEMSAFAWRERAGGVMDYRRPEARSGEHDDLVMALAIGTYIATRQPAQTRRMPRRPDGDRPVFSAAGY